MWHRSRKSRLLTLRWSRTSKSRFKNFNTGTQWIFAISLTILLSAKFAYVPTQEEIVQDLSTNLVPEDEVEADDSQESIPVKAIEAL